MVMYLLNPCQTCNGILLPSSVIAFGHLDTGFCCVNVRQGFLHERYRKSHNACTISGAAVRHQSPDPEILRLHPSDMKYEASSLKV